MIGRRTFSAGLLVLAAAMMSSPAMASPGFWKKIGEILGLGGDTMEGAGKAVDGIRKTDYPTLERVRVIEEIDRLNGRLDDLLPANSSFIDNIQAYVDRSRRPEPFPAEARAASWDRVKDDVGKVLELVDDVKNQLLNSTYLRARLDAATMSSLRQLMNERSNLLGQIRAMPAPAAPDEIDALDAFAERYRSVRERTKALQNSLFGARNRLAAV